MTYYLQGRNTYLSASTWPPPATRYRRLALAEDGRLQSVERRGRKPSADTEAATASYVTNPAAGFSLTFNKYGTVAATPYIPLDQRLEGPHGLTFRTPVLHEPMAITGPIALHLVAASTATDTDWYAKLSDVAPNGTESIITEGTLRASHRELDPARSRPSRPYHTHDDPQPIEPGRFYEYAIEIWPTAYELSPGHRLQLRLTSSDLPTHLPGSIDFDRDDPTAIEIDLNPPATNTVRLLDSYLLLPLLGPGAKHPGGAAAPAGDPIEPYGTAAPAYPGEGATLSGKVAAATLPATGASPMGTLLALAFVVLGLAGFRRAPGHRRG